MVRTLELRVNPEDHTRESLSKYLPKKLGVHPSRIRDWEVLRRSIDARKRPVRYVLRVQVWIDEASSTPPPFQPRLTDVRNSPEIHIIGMGPCGLFAALGAIAQGWKPILIERGKEIRDRRRDLALLTREGKLNPESNYCFGEGGAGTFSDGKLYTRSTKRGNIEHILQTFVYFGAPPDILVDSHPHIGTNKLPKIIEQMRETLLECGAEIHFNQRLTGFKKKGDTLQGIQLNDHSWISTQKVLLATGHSARDVFRLLDREKISIESKAFALGVRVEHPQDLIDSIQYHCKTSRPGELPPASYHWARTWQDRSIHSFCMCPGGIICPAATAPGEVVVNGWSPSKRNGKFANSGVVVQIQPSDVPNALESPLAYMQWQQSIEEKAFQAGGGNFLAPAQRLTDFLKQKSSSQLPDCSYLPGITSSAVDQLFPPSLRDSLIGAFQSMGKKMKGYLTEEAVVVGVESRTSSPVKIPRDHQTRQHPEVKGLFPCGEGAGYAGGIMSAAIDGWKTAQAACVSVE